MLLSGNDTPPQFVTFGRGATVLPANALAGDSVAPEFGLQVFVDRKPDNYTFANDTKEVTEAEIYEMYAPKG